MAEPAKAIYDDDKFGIILDARNPGSYDLWIGKRIGLGKRCEGEREIHFYLGRGILKELADARPGELLGKLELINPLAALQFANSTIGSYDLKCVLRKVVMIEDAKHREWAAERANNQNAEGERE